MVTLDGPSYPKQCLLPSRSSRVSKKSILIELQSCTSTKSSDTDCFQWIRNKLGWCHLPQASWSVCGHPSLKRLILHLCLTASSFFLLSLSGVIEHIPFIPSASAGQIEHIRHNESSFTHNPVRAFRLILHSRLYQSQLVICNQGECAISLWLFELPKILPAGFCLETVRVLSCSPPHSQSWLQVKLPQSEEQRTPVGDNEGLRTYSLVTRSLHCVAGKCDTSQQPYTRLWNPSLVLSLCQWNGSRLEAEEELLTTF